MKKILIFLSITALLLFIVILMGGGDVKNNFRKFTEEYREKLNSKNLQTNITIQNKEAKRKKVARHLSYTERIQKGDTLLKNGYPSLAIKEYTEAIAEDDEKSEPYLKIGKVYLETSKYDKALEHVKLALEIEPESMEGRIYLGKIFLKKMEFKNALNAFQSITAKNQTAKYYEGMLEAFFQNQDQAKNLFREVTELNTTEELSGNAKRFLNIFETFEKTEGTKNIYLKALLAKTYNEVGQYELAKEIAIDALKDKNDYRDVWIMLGYACLQTEDLDCSLDAFLTALNLDSEKAETQYFLGLTYFGLDNLEDAAEFIERALENGFEPAIQAKQKLAEIYFLLENYTEAVKNYEAIVHENPNNIEDFIRPIWLYIDHLLKPEKALLLAQESVERHPDNAMSHNLLGWANIANENYEEAEKNLMKALELDPDLAAAYLNLGQLEESLENYEKAKEYYRTAYDLSDNDAVGNLAGEKYNELLQKE